MTNAELIRILSQYPMTAVVKSYDSEMGDLMPITDVVYGSDLIELTTDRNEDPEETEGEED